MNSEFVPHKFTHLPILCSVELWLRIFFPQDWLDAGHWAGSGGSRFYPSVASFFDSMISEVSR